MTIIDDLERRHTFTRPVRRIISLSPAIAENLAAVGALSRIVGVSTADDYPADVKKLPAVGNFGAPAYERILALKPDVALAESGTLDRATALNLEKKMRCPVVAQISKRFDDVPRHLELLGLLTGNTKQAKNVSDEMRGIKRQVVQQVAPKIKSRPRPTVFVEVSREPLYTAGPGSFIDDLITLAGGVNIVKGTKPYPQYSQELLLAGNPEHYIITSGGDMSQADTKLPPPFDRLAAARNDKVHVVLTDWLFRPTPRLALGLKALAKALHG